MAGNSEGVKKAWLKRKRKGGSKKPAPRAETSDVMKKGDTIMSLAAKWGVSPKELIKLNGFTSPDQIKAGINIKIPAILSKEQKAANAANKQFDTNKKAQEKASKPKKTPKKKS